MPERESEHSEKISKILSEAAQKIKEAIDETLKNVEDFPLENFGKIDEGKKEGGIRTIGEICLQKAIWINNYEDHHFKKPVVLTPEGLFRTSCAFFEDVPARCSRYWPHLENLQSASEDEYLEYGFKAVWELEKILKLTKTKV